MPQENQVERRQTEERRRGYDRRSWQSQLDFPYVDSHGTLVSADRRHTVERRIEYAGHISSNA